jgi:RimJ/RimL family protein N-acetyltransferase
LTFTIARCSVLLSKTCSFTTQRLLVREWHSLNPGEWVEQDLAEVVATMLTEPVTESLPEAWRGAFTMERAASWVEERDAEGATLLVVERSSGLPVGLVILFEAQETSAPIELRLGYLLAESAWGKGIASELVDGLVSWSRQTGVASLVSGVERDNVASRRVLEKNGFACDPATKGAADQMFELRLRPKVRSVER